MSGWTYSSRLSVPCSVSMNERRERSPRDVIMVTNVRLPYVRGGGCRIYVPFSSGEAGRSRRWDCNRHTFRSQATVGSTTSNDGKHRVNVPLCEIGHLA